MRFRATAILLFFVLLANAQSPFQGINYQALVNIPSSSQISHQDISSVYFEFKNENGTVFFEEEISLFSFTGKIDVVIADDLSFSNKLYQNSRGEVTLLVFLKINGQKILSEERKLHSTLFANSSRFVIEKPSIILLNNVLVSNLSTSQMLSWNGIHWVNINDTITDYSVITGTGNYNFVNRSSYALNADTANYADTVLYAHTILNDLSLFGNSGRLEVGTLNDQDIVIKTNSVEHLRMTYNGFWNIHQSVGVANLSVSGFRGLLQVNRFGFGDFPNISKSNLFLWYPNKSALRMGEYSTSNIKQDTLGAFSFAFGKNNISNGLSASVVFGEDNVITPIPPFGLADASLTNGSSAFAFGKGCEALGIYSIAFGYESKARFFRSVSIGYKCLVDSLSGFSIAMGYNAKVGSNKTSTNATASIGFNTIASSLYSVALGSYSTNNNLRHCFVYGDISTTSYVVNTEQNQFMARASGGVVFYTSSDLSTGAMLNAGSGSWSNLSNRKSKTNIKKLNPEDYLPLLNNLTIYEWEYISEPGVVHIGPMSQNFYNTFGLGNSNKHISMVDADGVTLLMIKGLYSRFNQLEKSIHKLSKPKNEIDFSDIEQRINLIEQKLNQYEN